MLRHKQQRVCMEGDGKMSHFLQIAHYKGAITALKHIIKTGVNIENVQKTLEVYQCLLAECMPNINEGERDE
jgi:hypothetical protein